MTKLSYCKFCIYTHPVNSKFTIWHNHPNEAVFSDTNVHIGTKFEQVGILDFETFVKPT